MGDKLRKSLHDNGVDVVRQDPFVIVDNPVPKTFHGCPVDVRILRLHGSINETDQLTNLCQIEDDGFKGSFVLSPTVLCKRIVDTLT